MTNINGVLAKMREAGKMQNVKSKGTLGEVAVLSICYERKKKMGNGILYSSYMYPYQTNRSGVCYTGNIKFENNRYVEYTRDTLNDEIDVLYITPYRVFAIEVKSYKGKLELYDHWMKRGSTPVDKSPVAQAEKHVRHLYHAIHDVLPDGDPKYIVPLVCFVDKCTVIDNRSKEFREYIPVCVLNGFLSTLNRLNTKLEYNLDLDTISNKLQQKAVSIKKVL